MRAPRFSAASAALLVGAVGAFAQPGKRTDPLEEALSLARQPVLISQAIVDLKPGVDARAFAQQNRLFLVRPIRSLPNAWIMGAATVADASAAVRSLESNPKVEWVRQDRRVYMEPAQFSPNDPLYFYTNNTTLPGQWHLRNTSNLGRVNIDVRVWNAWQRNVTGAGVTIGVVDTCLEILHPDLTTNVSLADSWDFGQNDNDPSPVNAGDAHGTSVGGVAAARGGNGIGVTGAAPFAALAGLRVDFANQTEAMFIDATLYRSSGSTTTISIKNHSYGISSPYAFTPNQTTAINTSAAAGTIHMVAAGNWRNSNGEDTNRMDLQNEPSVITVAALGLTGTFASYSNFGASVFVTAPSSSSGLNGITTTDRTGASGYNGLADQNYTNGFGGTSSATPLAAGVMALAKQVQPALNVRFAKHLLTFCSDRVDAADASATSDGGWRLNAAGLRFNQNYGFGLINADKLTANAPLFTGVTPLATESIATTNVGIAIPDNNTGGVTQTFASTATGKLEEVSLNLSITHPFRGDLEVYLTSPSGTTGRLTRRSGDGGDNISWTYISNLFWGESPTGTWTIRVADIGPSDLGTWNSFSAVLRMGELILGSNSVASVAVAPSTVGGGVPSVGTVTLDKMAPINHPGYTINLSSSDPAVVVPASVTVLPGAKTATFAITTSPVPTTRTVVISASAWSTSAAANLTVEKMGVAGVSLNPALVKGGTSSTGTVTLNSPAPAGGQVVTLTSNRAQVTVPASITIAAGATTGQFTATTVGVSAQVQATIVARTNATSRFAVLTVDPPLLVSLSFSPATVAGGTSSTGTVTIDTAAGPGGFTVNLSSNRAAVGVPATMVVPEGATTGAFTATTQSVASLVQATVFATAGFRTRWAVLNVNPPGLNTHTVSPSTVLGGAGSIGTVTIDAPAPAAGIVVSLSSNRAGVVVPASVTIPSGQTSADYAITTSPTAVLVQATLFATFNGRSRWAVLNVNPPALDSHTVSPGTVAGTAGATGTVTLSAPAPPGGIVVELSSNRAEAVVPTTVTVPEGLTSATYPITTTSPASTATATLYARFGGRTRWTTLTITP